MLQPPAACADVLVLEQCFGTTTCLGNSAAGLGEEMIVPRGYLRLQQLNWTISGFIICEIFVMCWHTYGCIQLHIWLLQRYCAVISQVATW